MQRIQEEYGVTDPDRIGGGIGFPQLMTECVEAADDFARAAGAVAKRFEFERRSSLVDRPFVGWTFHYVGAGRWVARTAPHEDSEPLYVEWNGHVGRWDDARVHSSVEFLRHEETQPLRVRPRGTLPRERV
jgi:hypothetical protein